MNLKYRVQIFNEDTEKWETKSIGLTERQSNNIKYHQGWRELNTKKTDWIRIVKWIGYITFFVGFFLLLDRAW